MDLMRWREKEVDVPAMDGGEHEAEKLGGDD